MERQRGATDGDEDRMKRTVSKEEESGEEESGEDDEGSLMMGYNKRVVG